MKSAEQTRTGSAEYVLDLNKICQQFGTTPAVHALVDVNLRLRRGEWLAITGPSGAGKSSLLNILGCLDTPSSGRYTFEGIDMASLSEAQRAGLRSRFIGFVFQSFHLLPHRSVLENVMLAEVYRGEAQRGRRDRAFAAIERVGLAERADFLPTKLSGGERQRVAIARALTGSPSLLLCDEPTGNLDSKSTEAILELFAELNRQGLTLIVVTHEEVVATCASRRVHIIDGQLSHSDGLPVEYSALATPEAERSVGRSSFSLRDLLDEAVAGMFARPGRMLLTMIGIVIGLAALVATVGLSRTANNRIISQFDELAATEIVISAQPSATLSQPPLIPWDAPARLARLNGVVAAGTLSEVGIGDLLVSTSPIKDPLRQTAFKLSVQAASPELFTTVRAKLERGRLPDGGHSQRHDRVAVLGPSAALRLGIVSLEQLPAITIGDKLYLVIGILKSVARQPDLLGAVIIPEGTARYDFGLRSPATAIIETRIGAASLIAAQTPLALRPDASNLLKVEVPPEPQRVRDAVQTDLNILFLLLGGLTLIVGAIGIGNITLVSVIERTGEIGLRRAIGATRRHIATQFLVESTSLGVIGGIIGACLGILIVVAVSAYQVWTPVLDPEVSLLSPIIGAFIGLLAGTYPALRAARLEPVEAFRH